MPASAGTLVALTLAACTAKPPSVPPEPTGCGADRSQSCADIHAARCASGGDGPTALDGAHDAQNVFFDGSTIASWSYSGVARRYDAEGLALDVREHVAPLVDVTNGFAGVESTIYGPPVHFIVHRYDSRFRDVAVRDLDSDTRMTFGGHDDELIAIVPGGTRLFYPSLSERVFGGRVTYVDVNQLVWTGSVYGVATVGGPPGAVVQVVDESGAVSAEVPPPDGFVSLGLIGPGPNGSFYARASGAVGAEKAIYAIGPDAIRRGAPLPGIDALSSTDGTVGTLWQVHTTGAGGTLTALDVDDSARPLDAEHTVASWSGLELTMFRVRWAGYSTLVVLQTPHTLTEEGQVYIVRPCP